MIEAKQYQYLVVTDISTFYDNIDITTLINDLKEMNCDTKAISMLSQQLNKWSFVNNRGIPQGYSASDILAKLYLTTIDIQLDRANFDHYRFVDDYRIFCKSFSEAKKSVIKLTELLRKRGLSLHSAKTVIFSKEKAIQQLEGIIPTLKDIAKGFLTEIALENDISPSAIDIKQADNIISENIDKTPMIVIEEAYTKYIKGNPEFNKTLFHFLLNRLGKNKNDFALDDCLKILKISAQETEAILRYIKAIEKFDSTQNFLADLLLSPDTVYDYQKYQIITFINSNAFNCNERIKNAIRKIYSDPYTPGYVKTICRYFIKSYGDYPDLDLLFTEYNSSSPSEQCEIICALGRMEKSRRNSFYSRVENDGKFHNTAVHVGKLV